MYKYVRVPLYYCFYIEWNAAARDRCSVVVWVQRTYPIVTSQHIAVFPTSEVGVSYIITFITVRVCVAQKKSTCI